MKAIIVLMLPAMLAAQAQSAQTNSTTTPMGRATMAERNGNFAEAASVYASILKTQPASLGALIGMEHVLPRLDRRPEMFQLLRQALAADSASTGVLAIVVRNFASSGQADSARYYVARWTRIAPPNADPYREWSDAALMARDVAQARLALDVGREKLGPTALGIERAQLLQRMGDLAGAVQEWVVVVRETPPYRDAAVSLLTQVAPGNRMLVRDALVKEGSRDAKQIQGLLLAKWGESAAGAGMIRAALPADPMASTALLHELLDIVRNREDKESRLATAATLEALAAHETGAGAVHTLLDAARAFADAGDERNARRLLAVVAENPSAPGSMMTTASATLLGVLIAEGKGVEAERVLGELGSNLGMDEHDRLARKIAMLWARTGDVGRAEKIIAPDSSTAGLDLRGRFRLFVGDLAGASDLLKQAGPFDDDREQSLGRISLLTLIQAVGEDSVPALGAALLTLASGDSARAVTQLTALAITFKDAGAAETRLLAARVALARHDTVSALALLQLADIKELPATAAAARMEVAQIRIAEKRESDARGILEQLILDFPASALVPEARHLRDTLRGAVPVGGR